MLTEILAGKNAIGLRQLMVKLSHVLKPDLKRFSVVTDTELTFRLRIWIIKVAELQRRLNV